MGNSLHVAVTTARRFSDLLRYTIRTMMSGSKLPQWTLKDPALRWLQTWESFMRLEATMENRIYLLLRSTIQHLILGISLVQWNGMEEVLEQPSCRIEVWRHPRAIARISKLIFSDKCFSGQRTYSHSDCKLSEIAETFKSCELEKCLLKEFVEK